MPELPKDRLKCNYCKMRATKKEIVQHFLENKGTIGKLKTYYDGIFEDITPESFLEIAPHNEYEFYVYL